MATPADAVRELASRAEALWRRLQDIERALAVQEWWLLGRMLPEARVLAEIGSLLAVARGELETVLPRLSGNALPLLDQTDPLAAASAPRAAGQDPAWLAANRDQAIGLLRLVATTLPPMLQYAQLLNFYSGQLGLDAAITDAFGIVASRLGEVGETLREPPA
jgi:hypothetical protein